MPPQPLKRPRSPSRRASPPQRGDHKRSAGSVHLLPAQRTATDRRFAYGKFDRGSDGGSSCFPYPSACVTAVPASSQNE